MMKQSTFPGLSHEAQPHGKRKGTRLLVIAAVLTALGVGTASGAEAGSLITSRQIKNNSLLSQDIRNGTLTGSDFRDGSLSPLDFRGNTTGPVGGQGPTGPAGTPGVHNITVQSMVLTAPAGSMRFVEATCPTGFPIGGGLADNVSTQVKILESAPGNPARSWVTYVFNDDTVDHQVRAQAICADVAGR